MLTKAPVLAFPDFKRDFILETDASGTGLGAVLSHKQEDGTTKPICFASRTLQTHKANYAVSELEALAVVWAVKHFRVYLYGHTCDVYTDHEALLSLLNTLYPSGRLARRGLALQELNLNIHYRPGRLNKSADSLSSTEDNVSDGEVAQLQPDDSIIAQEEASAKDREGALLRERQAKDPKLTTVIQYLETGELPAEEKKAKENRNLWMCCVYVLTLCLSAPTCGDH